MMFKTSASQLTLLLLFALPAPVLAQFPAREPELPETTIPANFAQSDGVADGTGVHWTTAVRLDGDPSLSPTNRTLQQGFRQHFPGASIQIAGRGSDVAIQGLLDGDVDIAAIGRPLTPQEREQGLVAIPVARHKIAIIISPDNPFAQSLTDQQFAQIFRGEVTDWATVGGEPGPIRLIDRPNTSDTRWAFSSYPVFQDAPFQAADSAIQVNDRTDDVIKALGRDGIGYAIWDQVSNRPDVKIVPLHDVLPDDPRYSFSQPINYVYWGPLPTPAAQIFLGYVQAVSQSGNLVASKTSEAALGRSGEVQGERPGELAGNGTIGLIRPSAPATAEFNTGSNRTGPDYKASSHVDEARAIAEAETLQLDRVSSFTPSSNPSGSRVPWGWLLLPLAILPFLWKWIKQRPFDGQPDDGQSGRVFGGLFNRNQGRIPIHPDLSPLESEASGVAQIGEVNSIHPTLPSYRLILVPRDCHHAYAYWEKSSEGASTSSPSDRLPCESRALRLRLYDLSVGPLGELPFHQYDCQEGDLQIPIRHDNHTYQAELGHLTNEGQWQRLAQSEAVLVPACAINTSTIDTPTIKAAPSPMAQPSVELGSIGSTDRELRPSKAHAERSTIQHPQPDNNGCRIVIMPCDPKRRLTNQSSQASSRPQAYVYWDISKERRQILRQQGGQVLVLRIHDASRRKSDRQAADATNEYILDEQARDKVVEVRGDRDYVAEIGYHTLQGEFLSLGRSVQARIPKTKSTPK